MRVEARRLSMNSRRNVIAALVLSFMMIAISPFIGSGVLFANEGDQTETTGLSGCSLVFSYTNPSTETTKSIGVRIGQTNQIGPLLDKIGISNGEQDARGGIASVVSEAPSIVRVYEHEWAGWHFEALAADGNEFNLTVHFSDGDDAVVVVTTHRHHWTSTGDGTDALTVSCDVENCYYANNGVYSDKSYTAQISANDVTYDGNPHEATKELQTRFPAGKNGAFDVEEIHYVGIDGTEYVDSTTAPTDAGKYKAYYEVKPQGQDDVFTVQTTYTIAKADIKFEPAPAAAYPAGASSLTYNGEDQTLYTLGTAKSKVISDQTFPIKYWYENDSSQKVENQVLTGKDVGTIKIKYQSEGDANHNDTEIKTIEIKIGKRPVIVSGITANNKVYDGTTAATLNCDGAEFTGILEGDNLTVSAKGNFTDRNAGDNKAVNLTDLTLGGEDADKYTLATTGQQDSATANIAKKTLKVKWANTPELQYNGEEQVPEAGFDSAGELTHDDGKAYTGDDVQPVITGKHKELAVWTASVNSLSGDDASNYKLDSETSNVNYEYEIVPKELTVTWEDTEKEYDAKGLEPDYSLDGFVGGDKPSEYLSFTANPTELVGNKPVNAGSYKAKLELTGETATNYEITNPEIPFTITKAQLTVYTEGWIYYGEKVESKADIHDVGFDKDKCEGFKGDEGIEILGSDATFTTDYEYLDDATGVEGAEYKLIPQFGDIANYAIAKADGELTVYPKPVDLEWTHEHADEKNAVSGEQAFTYDGKYHKYTAEVSDDSYPKTTEGQQADLDITVETYKGNVQRDANAKAGTEKYTAEALTLSDPNYALADKDGEAIDTKSVDFTIAQLPAKLTWTPTEFTYNGKRQAPVATVTNLQTDDEGKKDADFAIDGRCEKTSQASDAEKESIETGDWTITAINGEKGQLEDENYTLAGGENLSANYVINQAPLTVKANDNAITYGQDPADAGVTYSGFQGDDDEGVLEGSAEYSYDYKRNDKPGSYTITPSGLTATNYKISFEPGTLTVNKRSNTLKIKGKTAKVKSKKLKKKTQKLAVTKVIRFTKKGQGKMTYKLVSAKKGKKNFKKYIKINAKTGKVTVKKNKKMKKGTYKVKVKAKAAGNDTYRASSWRTVTFKIRVK